MSPVRRAKHTTPAYFVDSDCDPIEVGGHWGLYVEIGPDAAAPEAATGSQSRAARDTSSTTCTSYAADGRPPIARYQLRMLRLPRHTTLPTTSG